MKRFLKGLFKHESDLDRYMKSLEPEFKIEYLLPNRYKLLDLPYGYTCQCARCKKSKECYNSELDKTIAALFRAINGGRIIKKYKDGSYVETNMDSVEGIEYPIEIKCKHFERKGTKVKPKKISG